jgi:hypothetical protein
MKKIVKQKTRGEVRNSAMRRPHEARFPGARMIVTPIAPLAT